MCSEDEMLELHRKVGVAMIGVNPREWYLRWLGQLQCQSTNAQINKRTKYR
uniref:Uncharacterized protein n=1 Tax=Rhizophora mucronata TaxID=61149 RepID=A0A2P2MAB7_RHIMU